MGAVKYLKENSPVLAAELYKEIKKYDPNYSESSFKNDIREMRSNHALEITKRGGVNLKEEKEKWGVESGSLVLRELHYKGKKRQAKLKEMLE